MKAKIKINDRKNATTATIQKNSDVASALSSDDAKSFELANRGFIAGIPEELIHFKNTTEFKVVWDPTQFNFVDGKYPETVNPSLWRQSKLTNISGLFEVVPGIYQVRNYDLANMTIIEVGEEDDRGIVIVDVLTCAETTEAALKLYYDNMGLKPVKAVIISHSHIDHFAGILNNYITLEDIQQENIKVYVPDGFVNAVYMENLYMGNVMGRRASYMYGNLLPQDAQGEIGAGLGTTRSTGSVTMIPEIYLNPITSFNLNPSISGLEIEFQLVPGTEAPAEMHFYIANYKQNSSDEQGYNILCTAENAVHTMHNVYSLRGAQIRDALAWSKDLNTALNKWGYDADVLIGVHHWPVWDSDQIVDYLKKQRDCYRYINDQTLRMANMGQKPVEIAEVLAKLPPALNADWDLRGYYGSLNHNVKSVFVKHIGWFDGNPANLHTLSKSEAAPKYIEFMGGAESVLKKAGESFANGDYRWVAEILNYLVLAEPDNAEAKYFLADTLEQLGYQAESGPWRNFYLSGAQELRNFSEEKIKLAQSKIATSFFKSCPLDLFYDYMGMLFNGVEQRTGKAVINISTNSDGYIETFQLAMENGVLNHTKMDTDGNGRAETPDATVSAPRKSLYFLVAEISAGKDVDQTLQFMLKHGGMVITGDQSKFELILNNLQVMNPCFDIFG